MLRFPPSLHGFQRCLDRLSPWLAALVPLAFGLLSVALGQDANWDLQNYHRYNPWAFATGRIGHDLAPAGMQSYFNPLLDLPYHWMTGHLPPRATGFAFGVLHGLNFLLLWSIGRRTLPAGTPQRIPMLLALAGCLGATFLSGFGNTMGDNMTALPMLGAVALALRHWPALRSGGTRGAVAGLSAGLLAGLGVGLKLTNAPYAVGLAIALFWALRGWSRPHRSSAIVAVAGASLGVLVGMAATGGHWFALMWQTFGNPLYPQFNSIFGSDLAVRDMVADKRWWPRDAVEWLLWPVIFTWNPGRFNEIPLVQLLWPVVYALFVLWFLRSAWRRLAAGASRRAPACGRPAREALAGSARFVLVFLVSSYFVWMLVFSIGRYVVTVELLLPLAAWIVWHRLAAPRAAQWLATGCIALAVLVSVGRFMNWGHAGWTGRYYTVPVPPIAQPERSALLMLAWPGAWVLPDFPPEMVFMTLNNPMLPESDGYRKRADAILASRSGPLYAIVMAGRDTWVEKIEDQLNRWLVEQRVPAGGIVCRAVGWTLHVPGSRRVGFAPGDASGPCAFAVPADQRKDLAAEDRMHVLQASEGIAAHGLAIDPADCVPFRAYMGTKPFAYQFCTVKRSPKSPPG